MKYLSVCSGIEAATVAWHSLGWTPVAFSEIEPYPSAVLQHHYPNVPNLGDMTKFHEWPADLNPDILVGGTPCQSFSVAGLRAGMDDPRGNLALTYLGIAERYRPRWIVWENVPGVLSSNGGRDFGSFLGALAKLGYGFCYRVLDAQFFGIAQQRRRVFVVGYFGDWRRAAAALFETPRVQRYSSESRRTRPKATGGPAQDAGGGGIAGTIGRSYEKGHGRTGGANGGVARGHLIPSAETSLCLNAGGMGRQDFETETMVVELANTLTGRQNQQRAEDNYVAAPLPFDPVQITSPDNRSNPKPGCVCHAIPSQEKPPCIAFEPRDRGDDGRGYGRPPAMLEDIAPTVNATKTACVTPPEAYGFQQRIARNGRGDMGETVHALTSEAGEDGRGDSAPCVAVTLHGSDKRVKSGATESEVATSLRTSPPGEISNSSTTVAMQRAGVRRLTCRECERLQGFPDDYTLIPWKGRRDTEDYAETVEYLIAAGWPEDEAKALANTPDGPRYKSIGNSMAVPVMAWIGQQIAIVDTIP